MSLIVFSERGRRRDARSPGLGSHAAWFLWLVPGADSSAYQDGSCFLDSLFRQRTSARPNGLCESDTPTRKTRLLQVHGLNAAISLAFCMWRRRYFKEQSESLKNKSSTNSHRGQSLHNPQISKQMARPVLRGSDSAEGWNSSV